MVRKNKVTAGLLEKYEERKRIIEWLSEPLILLDDGGRYWEVKEETRNGDLISVRCLNGEWDATLRIEEGRIVSQHLRGKPCLVVEVCPPGTLERLEKEFGEKE